MTVYMTAYTASLRRGRTDRQGQLNYAGMRGFSFWSRRVYGQLNSRPPGHRLVHMAYATPPSLPAE